MSYSKDILYMSRAIELARKGRYGAHPNPMVGAALVKNGRVIGEGWHKEFGRAHAEVNAVRNAGAGARGSTLYVTLEPCSTRGKTGPCTQALIAAGVKRVVIGATDPASPNSGKAARILRAAGIEVKSGVLAEAARAINPVFEKFMRTGLPYVTLKISQSMDGKIADFKGRSRWISSAPARVETHRLRAEADAVLAGINTILLDDPRLDVRHIKVMRQPAVVVLDSGFRIPFSARVFGSKDLLVATTRSSALHRSKAPGRENTRILVLPPDRRGGIDLPALLRELGKLGISHLFVEGGGRVIGSFIAQGLFDRFMLFLSPLVIGGEKSRGSVVWPDALNAARKELGIRLKFNEIRQIGPDLLIEAEPENMRR